MAGQQAPKGVHEQQIESLPRPPTGAHQQPVAGQQAPKGAHEQQVESLPRVGTLRHQHVASAGPAMGWETSSVSTARCWRSGAGFAPSVSTAGCWRSGWGCPVSTAECWRSEAGTVRGWRVCHEDARQQQVDEQ